MCGIVGISGFAASAPEPRVRVARMRSETDVLLSPYEAPPASVERDERELAGTGEFATRDRRRQRTFLWRDRFGIKPLFVASCGRTLAFASELTLAPSGRDLATFHASLPGWMRIGDPRRLALQPLDTPTDGAIRGELHAAARWLTPSAPSLAFFRRRRDAGVREIDVPTPGLDRPWERSSANVGVATERDVRSLDRRLFQRSEAADRVFVDKAGDGDLRALCSSASAESRETRDPCRRGSRKTAPKGVLVLRPWLGRWLARSVHS